MARKHSAPRVKRARPLGRATTIGRSYALRRKFLRFFPGGFHARNTLTGARQQIGNRTTLGGSARDKRSFAGSLRAREFSKSLPVQCALSSAAPQHDLLV